MRSLSLLLLVCFSSVASAEASLSWSTHPDVGSEADFILYSAAFGEGPSMSGSTSFDLSVYDSGPFPSGDTITIVGSTSAAVYASATFNGGGSWTGLTGVFTGAGFTNPGSGGWASGSGGSGETEVDIVDIDAAAFLVTVATALGGVISATLALYFGLLVAVKAVTWISASVRKA